MVQLADPAGTHGNGRNAPKAVVAVTAAGFGNFELIVVVFLFQAVQSVVEHSKARPIKATLAMFRQNSATGRSRRRKRPRTPSRPRSSARHCSPGVVPCRAVATNCLWPARRRGR